MNYFKLFLVRWRWWLVVILLAVNIAVWLVVLSRGHTQLKIAFLDVGQGDAEFIQAPNGNQVLIDGGPGEAVLRQLGQVMPFYDRSIDLLILTHPHADHLDGLIAVLKRYQVGAVLESNVEYPSSADYVEWHRLLAEQGTLDLRAARGEQIILDRDLTLSILTPFSDFTGRAPKNVHEAMVVAKLTYASSSVLFTGDMEQPLEAQLLAAGDDLRANVLKVGHHGSKTSTSPAFLQAVAPRVAVISVGAGNRYGHPNQKTLDTLTAASTTIWRTDQNGTMILNLER